LRPASQKLDCSFCGRSSEQVNKLVAGPNIFICDGCARKAERAVRELGQYIGGREKDDFTLLDKGSRLRCSFCSKLPSYQLKVVAAKHQICAKCVELTLTCMSGPAEVEAPLSIPVPQEKAKAATVILWLQVENGSKFTRGKTKAREEIERFVLSYYQAKKLSDAKYELTIPYRDDVHLNKLVQDMLVECSNIAGQRECFAEGHCSEVGTDRTWR
jgi:ATP-dependent protease Clp ATPase subunit